MGGCLSISTVLRPVSWGEEGSSFPALPWVSTTDRISFCSSAARVSLSGSTGAWAKAPGHIIRYHSRSMERAEECGLCGSYLGNRRCGRRLGPICTASRKCHFRCKPRMVDNYRRYKLRYLVGRKLNGCARLIKLCISPRIPSRLGGYALAQRSIVPE